MNGFENFMVSKLFKIDDSLEEISVQGDYDIDISKYTVGKRLKYEKLTWFGQLKQEISVICTCKKMTFSKHEKNFQLGR